MAFLYQHLQSAYQRLSTALPEGNFPAWLAVQINLQADDSNGPAASSRVGLLQQQQQQHGRSEKSAKQISTMALKSLLQYDQAPRFLQGNPYIRTGYRAFLSPQLCLKSMFWWTNETMNIWTHMVGLAFFVLLLLYDSIYAFTHYQVSSMDRLVVTITMVLFQFSMFMSTAYHIFGCHSEQAYRLWLAWDLTGVSFSILGIFLSGIYYAFACFPAWRIVYSASVMVAFGAALSMAFDPKFITEQYQFRRLVIYCSWVVYGLVPTIHWVYLNGGADKYIVQALFPRVVIMYLIIALAFFFYVSHYPERLCPGRLDFIGASHQLWHILVILAFYWWHNTGLIYVQVRNLYPCSS